MKIICLLFLLSMFHLSLSAQQILSGRVVKVADGDTFTLLVNGHEQVKVRLEGIDAPEKKQAFGIKAKEFLSSMIWNQGEVTISVSKKDRYGRFVAKVSTSSVEDVNLEMIKAGYAWHYTDYSNDELYSVAESKAREDRVGLWQDPDPIRPQDFRKKKTTPLL